VQAARFGIEREQVALENPSSNMLGQTVGVGRLFFKGWRIMGYVSQTKSGKWRVAWIGLVGIQNSVLYPKDRKAAAESFAAKIDRLVEAVKGRGQIDAEIRGWLIGLDDFVYDRLVYYGLAEKRTSTQSVVSGMLRDGFELAEGLQQRVIAYVNELGYFPDEAQAHDIFGEINKLIASEGGEMTFFGDDQLKSPLFRQAIDPIIERVMTPKPKSGPENDGTNCG
jgi:hypothetical protein